MRGKKFKTTLNEVIATVIQWDDTSALYICQYPWGEYFYEDEEYIRENLIQGLDKKPQCDTINLSKERN